MKVARQLQLQLGQSNKTRDLSIIIDNKLNFNSHISQAAR